MKHRGIDEAIMAIFKDFFSHTDRELEAIKGRWHRISRPFIAGLCALAFHCGVSAEPFAYVTNRAPGASGVWVIDTASNTLVNTIPLPSAVGVVVSPKGDFVYVAGNSGIYAISTATKSVVAMAPIQTIAVNIAVSPDGAFIYAAHPEGGYVTVIETTTFQVTATIRVGTYPLGLDITPDGAFVYVSVQGVPGLENSIASVISTATNTVVATVPIGNASSSIAVSPNGKFAYATNRRSNSVSVILTATNTVNATVSAEGTNGLESVVFTPDNAFAYVTSFADNKILVIDTATNTLSGSFPAGGSGPVDLSVTPDGKFMYVANAVSGTVTVFALPTHAQVATFNLGGQPSTIARFNVPLSTPQGLLAVEGGTFSAAKATLVRYGADTRWVEKTVTGKAICSNAFFGTDPAPGILKSCVTGTPGQTPLPIGSTLATEGDTFSVSAATAVRYGTRTRWFEKTVTGTATCSNAFFGTDPAPGILKSCVVGTGVEKPLTPGSFLASEHNTFVVSAKTLVRYGSDRRWVEKTVTGKGTCSNEFFGADPAPGILKSCGVGHFISTLPSIGLILAKEGTTFAVSEESIVVYGAGTHRVEKTVNGTVNCDNAFFGGDPAPGLLKYCIFVKTTIPLRQ